MKRILTAILALLMLCTPFVLASCGEETQSEAEKAPAEEIKDEALVPSLGKTDKYSGKTLRILTTGENWTFGKEPLGATETNSEPVNNACYERFVQLENAYGITVATEFTVEGSDFTAEVRNDRIAGTVDYDVVCNGLQWMSPLATEGYFLDYLSIGDSHLDLNASWWDAACQEDMTIAGRLFFATGDIILMDDEYTYAVFYNKDLADENNIEDLSRAALENKWTLDLMYETALTVSAPDGDGIMDVTTDDTWGLVGWMYDIYNLIVCCDAPIVDKNEQGIPAFAVTNERNIRAFEKANEMFSDKTVTARVEDFYAWNSPDAGNVHAQFYNGKAMFVVDTIRAVNSDDLREADFRYGILPMPKYDETQETYRTPVNPYSFFVLSIMDTCTDTDFVTFALEAMAYLGEKQVTPEYYDRTLKYKRFPDDTDSSEVLDIIFSNRLVDIAIAYNWDDCTFYYQNAIWSGNDIVSYMESRRGAFEAAMQQTLDGFAETIE
ncbi:MAG: carbohydrate ABC transporter substrate-binding protein [Clostridia bacterium]|nr:carbohydrate ABC transporter substrate-binding protein [Clostridia bacterium]